MAAPYWQTKNPIRKSVKACLLPGTHVVVWTIESLYASGNRPDGPALSVSS